VSPVGVRLAARLEEIERLEARSFQTFARLKFAFAMFMRLATVAGARERGPSFPRTRPDFAIEAFLCSASAGVILSIGVSAPRCFSSASVHCFYVAILPFLTVLAFMKRSMSVAREITRAVGWRRSTDSRCRVASEPSFGRRFASACHLQFAACNWDC